MDSVDYTVSYLDYSTVDDRRHSHSIVSQEPVART